MFLLEIFYRQTSRQIVDVPEIVEQRVAKYFITF